MKHEDEGHLFTEEVNDYEEDSLMLEHRHDHNDTIRARDEEDISMSHVSEENVESATHHQDALVHST